MTIRQYIGARYVPIFGRKDEESIEWDPTGTYEPLTIVLHQGNSYTSRQFVPVGVDITNEEYWALTGNYNAQVEAYRQQVQRLSDTFESVEETASDALELAQNTSDALADYRVNTNGQLTAIGNQLAGNSASGLLSLITADGNRLDGIDGQLAGTSSSGLLDLITADENRLDGIDGQLAGTSGSGLKTSIEENKEATDAAIEALDKTVDAVSTGGALAKLIKPVYVGSHLATQGMQGLAACGDLFYIATYSEGHGSSVAVYSRTTNSRVRVVDITPEQHLNSLCYDATRDCIWVGSTRQYNREFTYYETVSTGIGASCIAYDYVTHTLWAFVGVNTDATQEVYKMEADESTFTHFCTIDTPLARQDMAVYNDVMVINSTRGWVDVMRIRRDTSTIERMTSYQVDHVDSSYKWSINEPEGLAFDENGYLFMGYTTLLGVGDNDLQGYMCFVTTIPFMGKVYPNTPQITTLVGHPVLGLHSDYQNQFTLAINQLSSLGQLTALASLNQIRRIDFLSDFVDTTYTGSFTNGSILIQNSGHTVRTLPLHVRGGIIEVNNTGTWYTSGSFVSVTNTAALVLIRNTGTIHNTSHLVAYGVVPAIAFVHTLGTVDDATIGDNYYTAADYTYVIGRRGGTF